MKAILSYFTGTGNLLAVAKGLCSRLGAPGLQVLFKSIGFNLKKFSKLSFQGIGNGKILISSSLSLKLHPIYPHPKVEGSASLEPVGLVHA